MNQCKFGNKRTKIAEAVRSILKLGNFSHCIQEKCSCLLGWGDEYNLSLFLEANLDVHIKKNSKIVNGTSEIKVNILQIKLNKIAVKKTVHIMELISSSSETCLLYHVWVLLNVLHSTLLNQKHVLPGWTSLRDKSPLVSSNYEGAR